MNNHLDVSLNEKIDGKYASVEDSNYWIDKICVHNGGDPDDFTHCIWKVVDKKLPKINTLHFLG